MIQITDLDRRQKAILPFLLALRTILFLYKVPYKDDYAVLDEESSWNGFVPPFDVAADISEAFFEVAMMKNQSSNSIPNLLRLIIRSSSCL